MLEAPQRSVRARAEVAVERPGGKAVPGERELEGGDVPAARAEGELPAPEGPAPPVAAHCLASARPGHAVGGQACASLEASQRLFGPGTEHAVDRPRVQPARPQADLKRGDVGVAARKGAARKAQRQKGQHGNRCRSDPHPGTRIGKFRPGPIPQKGDFDRGIKSPTRGTRGRRTVLILHSGGPFDRGEKCCGEFERCRPRLMGRRFPWGGCSAPACSWPPRSTRSRRSWSRRGASTRSSTASSTTACSSQPRSSVWPGVFSCAPSGSRGSSSERPSRSGRPATSTTTSS